MSEESGSHQPPPSDLDELRRLYTNRNASTRGQHPTESILLEEVGLRRIKPYQLKNPPRKGFLFPDKLRREHELMNAAGFHSIKKSNQVM